MQIMCLPLKYLEDDDAVELQVRKAEQCLPQEARAFVVEHLESLRAVESEEDELVRLVGQAPSRLFRDPTTAMNQKEIGELVTKCDGAPAALKQVRRLKGEKVVFGKPPELTEAAEVCSLFLSLFFSVF
jgi:hypothetical protein